MLNVRILNDKTGCSMAFLLPSKIIKNIKGIRDFVRHFHPNQIYLYPSKSSEMCPLKMRIFVQFSKIYFLIRIVFRNGKFFSSEIVCVVNNQYPNVRQYVIFFRKIGQGYTRGRLSTRWGAAFKVLTMVAREHIWNRSTTSQLENGKVSFKILRNRGIFYSLQYSSFFANN